MLGALGGSGRDNLAFKLGGRVKHSQGMVVSAHPMASKAGAAVLRKGGNAVDAAIATSLMLGVVEPAFSGIGGGGFALIRMHTGEISAIDYRETAPAGSTPDMFTEGSDTNRVGPLAIATPGLLAGTSTLLDRYGTMKFADLAAPAAAAARDGLGSGSLSREMLRDKNSTPYKKIKRFQTSSEVFFGKKRFPLLARMLEHLRLKGPAEFYHGSISESVARYLKGEGGQLTHEDLAVYAPKTRKPVRGKYKGLEVISMPPPSAGGTLLIHGLEVAEGLGQKKGDQLISNNIALMRLMLSEKWRFGDPDFVEVPAGSFLTDTAEEASAGKLLGASQYRPPRDTGSTSHFSVVDKKGNVVAATETIECYYGSGVTIPGLGLIMNDEMHDFDVVPGRPNSVAPLKRPVSSMVPTIILKDDQPFLVLGSAGSERIITSVFQTVRNVVEGGMSLAKAVASPRVHPAGDVLEIEGGMGASAISMMERAGNKTHLRSRRDAYFGGVHAIMIDPDSGKISGAADPRRRGVAAAG